MTSSINQPIMKKARTDDNITSSIKDYSSSNVSNLLTGSNRGRPPKTPTTISNGN